MKDHAPIVELLCPAEAPYARTLRRQLRQAMIQLDLLPSWQEYDPVQPDLPKRLHRIHPPAVLVNQIPVWEHSGGGEGVIPEPGQLAKFMQSGLSAGQRLIRKKRLKTHLSFFLALGIAFFPKCPFCWAAYMSMFGFLGIGTISYQPWLLPVFTVAFLINVLSLYATRNRHGLKPLILSLSGASLIILNRYYFENIAVLSLGAAMLVSASLWNSLSRRMALSVGSYFGRKKIGIR